MGKLDMGLLAERLRTMREAQGLSQTALAARAELNLGNVNELELHRKRGVRAETIVALADALHVSTDYLLGRTETPTCAPRRRTLSTPLPPRQPRTRTRRQSAVPTRPRTTMPVS